MMLWQRMAQDCYLLELVSTADGTGGYKSQWSRRDKFKAAIVQAGTIESSTAGKPEEVASYTVTSATLLPYGTVIERVSDGKVLRITSTPQDAQTPEAATFAFYQVQAEETRLAND